MVLGLPLRAKHAPPGWDTDLPRRLRHDGFTVVGGPSLHAGPSTGGRTDPVHPTAAGTEADESTRWVAAHASAISRVAPTGALLIAVAGAAAMALPALARSQRAARRSVLGYVIVDGPVVSGPAAGDWPEAPVLYVQGHDPWPRSWRQATLRGWATTQGDPALVIPSHVRCWPEPPRARPAD